MKPIRLSKSTVTDEDINAVVHVLKQEYLGMGSFVQQFEKSLTEFFGRTAICINTGTAALQLALQAVEVGPGDEVLVQSLTYVASYQAISATGAKPVSCEILAEDFTLDLADAKKKISPKTKAVMPMHYSGCPGNLDKIYAFAEENNLRVIEDAAHAFGTVYNGTKIGSQGDIVCFSFDGIKNITSGEGGAIVTSDNKVIDRVKDLRLLGVQKDTEKRFSGQRSWDFNVSEQGWRYHMSNIMAAIGSSQLRRFDQMGKKRRQLAQTYKSMLTNNRHIMLLEIDYNNVVPHIFVIRVLNDKRDALKTYLENENIQTGIHYKPNHMLSLYSDESISLSTTEEVYGQILTLPLHLDLEEECVKEICKMVNSFQPY
jgi:dTDP-4-amino-4,6-dideoxygalactose transaminase